MRLCNRYHSCHLEKTITPDDGDGRGRDLQLLMQICEDDRVAVKVALELALGREETWVTFDRDVTCGTAEAKVASPTTAMAAKYFILPRFDGNE